MSSTRAAAAPARAAAAPLALTITEDELYALRRDAAAPLQATVVRQGVDPTLAASRKEKAERLREMDRAKVRAKAASGALEAEKVELLAKRMGASPPPPGAFARGKRARARRAPNKRSSSSLSPPPPPPRRPVLSRHAR